MTVPDDVAWSRLSPRGHEIVEQIALRAAAGFSTKDVAQMLNTAKPKLKHLELPDPVDSTWVSRRMSELRLELQDVSD